MYDITVRITDAASGIDQTIDIRAAKPDTMSAGATLGTVEDRLAPGAVAAYASRFVKIDAKGNAVADSAKKWAAVRDNSTGLIWSAENVGKGETNHAAAITACRELELAGHSDWRLPTIRELQSLVAFERHEPAIDIAFFPTCRSAWYWSDTICAWSSDFAWVVNFYYGDSLSYHRDSYGAFVRAVRSVPASQ